MMDPRDELVQERARRQKLEGEIAFWHEQAVKKISPDILAANIQSQQIESLSYHLLKQKQSADDFAAKLKAKEKDLALAVQSIERLEKEGEAKDKEIGKLKKAVEEFQSAASTLKMTPSSPAFQDDWKGSQAPVSAQPQTAGPPKTIKDLAMIMRRMERVKLWDAALLLDMPAEDVLVWAKALETKGYITVEGVREKTLVASEKILKNAK